MLCPIPTGKSCWLDRLRSSRGFSDDAATGAVDLHNFILPSSPNPGRSKPTPNSDQKRDDGKQLFGLMSGVLNELFYFGDNCCNSSKLKKSARKQANPKVCAFPRYGGIGESHNEALEKATVSRVNSRVEEVRTLTDQVGRNDDHGGDDGVLSGFSRTEVTVIDTSYAEWKFDKMLYRKNKVWKVRDKKGKNEYVGNKRKRNLKRGGEEDD